jgi:O-antigen ligase
MKEKLGRLAEGASTWSLAALLLILPFWGHWVLFGQPVDPVLYDYHEIVLYATDLFLWTALAGWLLSRLLSGSTPKLQWGPLFLLVPQFGLLALGLIGVLQAVDPVYAAYGVVRLAFLPVFYLMLVNAPVKRELIVWPLAAGMAIQGAVGVPQFLLGRSLGLKWLGETPIDAGTSGASVVMVGEQRWLRAYGLTQHPNVLGGLLMASFWVVIGHYLTQRGWRRIALLGLLVAGWGTLLVPFSRGAWLGVAVGGLVMGGCLLFWPGAARQPHRSVSRSTVTMLAGVLVAALLVFVLGNWQLLRPRLGLVSQGVEVRSLDERGELNSAALTLIEMRPWLGVGLSNFSEALLRLAPGSVSKYRDYSPVHNVLLLTTAELGLPGGVVWLCLLVLPWLALWLRRRQVQMAAWWAGLSAALAALAVVSFLDHYVWSFQQGRLILWLVLGLWAREWMARSGQKEVEP